MTSLWEWAGQEARLVALETGDFGAVGASAIAGGDKGNTGFSIFRDDAEETKSFLMYPSPRYITKLFPHIHMDSNEHIVIYFSNKITCIFLR